MRKNYAEKRLKKSVRFYLTTTKGESPIYDLTARIVDLQEFKKYIDSGDVSPLLHFGDILNLGNIPSGISITINPFDLGKGDIRGFNIFFVARNGYYKQLVRFRKINSDWKLATKVERYGEIIYKKIDKDYPTNKAGNVKW